MVVATVVVASLFAASSPVPAQAVEVPSSIVDGGFIIGDEEFFDGTALSANEVQSFLESRVRTCRATSGPACLKDFRTTLPSFPADRYCDAISGGTNLRASDVIARVGAACDVNPKVILVMLQKEQGLVTATAPSEWSYRAAMGQMCPDDAPCDAAAAGFVNQVRLGARQQQIYVQNPQWFRYKAGQTNTIQWSPDVSCGTSQVYIRNQATANLYNYTPYRPNVAALAAGYGVGDECSTYGNRNFYNYYAEWFAGGLPTPIPACTEPADADVVSWSGRATVVGSTINVRPAPTTGCPRDGELAVGTTVTVTGIYGAWTRVTVGSRSRWLSSCYLEYATTPPNASFADVSLCYVFAKEISWLASEGISTGWETSGRREYRPLQPVLRDQMAAFLYRAAGSPEYTPPATSPFIDVPTGYVFYKEIAWLASEGISTGWDVGGGKREYRPFQPVLRDQMAAFLYRAAGKPAYTPPPTSPFADVSPGYVFYREIAWLASEGISTGWEVAGRREYRSHSRVLRDVMAAFLYRYEGR